MQPITIHVSRKKLRALKLLIVGFLIIGVAFWLDGRIRPIISTLSSYQAKLAATRSVNDAVLRIISEEGLGYEDIMSVTHDENGRVTSLSSNMVALNRLKAQISNAVAEQLIRDEERPVFIPVGTLFGGQFFSGRGPSVEFRILPAGYVETQVYNKFQSAGINQTLHQVMITVTTEVSGVMPVYTITTRVSTDICIGETVIVGEVPQSFTDISGDSRGLLDKVNDYAGGS